MTRAKNVLHEADNLVNYLHMEEDAENRTPTAMSPGKRSNKSRERKTLSPTLASILGATTPSPNRRLLFDRDASRAPLQCLDDFANHEKIFKSNQVGNKAGSFETTPDKHWSATSIFQSPCASKKVERTTNFDDVRKRSGKAANRHESSCGPPTPDSENARRGLVGEETSPFFYLSTDSSEDDNEDAVEGAIFLEEASVDGRDDLAPRRRATDAQKESERAVSAPPTATPESSSLSSSPRADTSKPTGEATLRTEALLVADHGPASCDHAVVSSPSPLLSSPSPVQPRIPPSLSPKIPRSIYSSTPSEAQTVRTLLARARAVETPDEIKDGRIKSWFSDRMLSAVKKFVFQDTQPVPGRSLPHEDETEICSHSTKMKCTASFPQSRPTTADAVEGTLSGGASRTGLQPAALIAADPDVSGHTTRRMLARHPASSTMPAPAALASLEGGETRQSQRSELGKGRGRSEEQQQQHQQQKQGPTPSEMLASDVGLLGSEDKCTGRDFPSSALPRPPCAAQIRTPSDLSAELSPVAAAAAAAAIAAAAARVAAKNAEAATAAAIAMSSSSTSSATCLSPFPDASVAASSATCAPPTSALTVTQHRHENSAPACFLNPRGWGADASCSRHRPELRGGQGADAEGGDSLVVREALGAMSKGETKKCVGGQAKVVAPSPNLKSVLDVLAVASSQTSASSSPVFLLKESPSSEKERRAALSCSFLEGSSKEQHAGCSAPLPAPPLPELPNLYSPLQCRRRATGEHRDVGASLSELGRADSRKSCPENGRTCALAPRSGSTLSPRQMEQADARTGISTSDPNARDRTTALAPPVEDSDPVCIAWRGLPVGCAAPRDLHLRNSRPGPCIVHIAFMHHEGEGGCYQVSSSNKEREEDEEVVGSDGVLRLLVTFRPRRPGLHRATLHVRVSRPHQGGHKDAVHDVELVGLAIVSEGLNGRTAYARVGGEASRAYTGHNRDQSEGLEKLSGNGRKSHDVKDFSAESEREKGRGGGMKPPSSVGGGPIGARDESDPCMSLSHPPSSIPHLLQSHVAFAQGLLSFGKHPVGSVSVERVRLCNPSTVPQLVVLERASLPFVLTHRVIKLRPRAYVQLPIRFIPVQLGEYECTLRASVHPVIEDEEVISVDSKVLSSGDFRLSCRRGKSVALELRGQGGKP